MTRAIVKGYNIAECERRYKRYCNAFDIPCRRGEAVFITSQMSRSEQKEKIRGRYNDVIECRIVLINMTLIEFKYLYFSYD
jgi:hypothetical protein